jgi:hypothetical protein
MAAHTWWRIDVTSRTGANYYTGFVECSMRTSLGGSNACSGGTPSASSSFSSFGRTPDKALDSDNATFWCTDPAYNSGWWAYNFASAVDIVEFTIRMTSAEYDYLPRTVGLSHSDNGTDWTVALAPRLTRESVYFPPNNLDFVYRVSGGDASSYWRIRTTSATDHPAIATLELRASIGGADQCNGSGGYADSTNDYWVASSQYPDLAFDGNSTTYHVGSGAGLPTSLIFRFLEDTDVVEYVVRKYNGSGFHPIDWTLDYSGDGLTWVTSDTRTGQNAWSDNESKTFVVGGYPGHTGDFFLML